MATNKQPIFVLTPQNEWAAIITAANTATDGTGTVSTIFTADATNGSFINKIIARSCGSCTTSVLRVFLNNGSTNSTAGNNILIAEATLASTTSSNTSGLIPVEIPLNLAMQAGYKINVTLGTAVSSGYAVSAHGGKY
jgi:hypothetical protein